MLKMTYFFIFNLCVYMYVHVFMCLSCVFRFLWGQNCVKEPLELALQEFPNTAAENSGPVRDQ